MGKLRGREVPSEQERVAPRRTPPGRIRVAIVRRPTFEVGSQCALPSGLKKKGCFSVNPVNSFLLSRGNDRRE